MVDNTIPDNNSPSIDVFTGRQMVDAAESVHSGHQFLTRHEQPFLRDILFNNTAYKRRAGRCTVRLDFQGQ
jgi:hypothetical protein